MGERRTDSATELKLRFYGRRDLARRYSDQRYRSSVGRRILANEQAIVARLVPRGAGERALDVGTGNGPMLPFLQGLGYRPIGVDFSAAMLAEVPAGAGSVVRADAARLPFADGSVAGILAHRFLYHYPAPAPLLAEFARVLRPGGWACLDLVQWSPAELKVLAAPIVQFLAGAQTKGKLVHVHRRAELTVAIERAGFRVRASRDAFPLNPAAAMYLPTGASRALLRPDALPWIPRVKRYLLLTTGEGPRTSSGRC